MSKTALKLALETAEQIACADYRHWEELASLSEFERWARSRANHIADALRTALAQPEPEPVQWQKRHTIKTVSIWENTNEHDAKWWRDNSRDWEIRALYTAPPQREWVGLTDEEITSLVREAARGSAINRDGSTSQRIARAIEATLKAKNALPSTR